jgi:electron transfer flavoprotein beta subunit
MKILVAIKQVPECDAVLRIAEGNRGIEEPSGYMINEPDMYALEEALQLKEKHSAEVIALTLGSERASGVLRDALAKGADRAIHVQAADANSSDAFSTATRIAAVIRAEFADALPDLILTGLQSNDFGSGQTGVILAELLNLPSSTIITDVEIENAATLRVKRELEDGWFQTIEMRMPALLTIQSGSKQLRYATLMGIKKAKTKEIKNIDAAALNVAAATSFWLERLYAPEKQKQTQVLTGTSQQAAAALVEKLREVNLL